MLNKKYIFHIKTYNDLDHMSPIIYTFLNKSERVDILFLTFYDFENDYRIKYFKKNYTNLRIIRVSFLQNLRSKIFLNSYVSYLMRKMDAPCLA